MNQTKSNFISISQGASINRSDERVKIHAILMADQSCKSGSRLFVFISGQRFGSISTPHPVPLPVRGGEGNEGMSCPRTNANRHEFLRRFAAAGFQHSLFCNATSQAVAYGKQFSLVSPPVTDLQCAVRKKGLLSNFEFLGGFARICPVKKAFAKLPERIIGKND